MPVKIETFAPFSEAEFDALRQKQAGTTDRAMVALLEAISTGHLIRIALVQGQSARGMRAAISRAALSRGINVVTVAGNGSVAARKVEQPPARRGRSRKPHDESTNRE